LVDICLVEGVVEGEKVAVCSVGGKHFFIGY